MTAFHETFQHGDTYKGEVLAHTSDREIDKIEINGIYPEAQALGEVWIRNQESQVRVKVRRGAGSIAIRSALQLVGGKVRFDQYHLANPEYAHDSMQSITVPPNTWYAWQSEGGAPFETLATFEPPLDPEKYEIKTEDEILNERHA